MLPSVSVSAMWGSGAGRTQFREGPRMNESDIPNTAPGIFGWEVLEHGV